MASIFRKMFWGVIIATFQIRIGVVPILPEFIGWVIVLDGLIDLGNISFFEEVPRLKLMGVSLVVANLIHEGLVIFSPLSLRTSTIWMSFPIIILLIEFILVHKLFESSVYYFQKMNDEKVAQKIISRDRLYIILMAINLIILTVSIIAYFDFMAVVGVVLSISIRIYFIWILYSLSKIDYPQVGNVQNAY